jgi:hypothetical protein
VPALDQISGAIDRKRVEMRFARLTIRHGWFPRSTGVLGNFHALFHADASLGHSGGRFVLGV